MVGALVVFIGTDVNRGAFVPVAAVAFLARAVVRLGEAVRFAREVTVSVLVAATNVPFQAQIDQLAAIVANPHPLVTGHALACCEAWAVLLAESVLVASTVAFAAQAAAA